MSMKTGSVPTRRQQFAFWEQELSSMEVGARVFLAGWFATMQSEKQPMCPLTKDEEISYGAVGHHMTSEKKKTEACLGFLGLTKTKYHKLVTENERNGFSHILEARSPLSCMGRAGFSWRLRGRVPPGLQWPPTAGGILWCVIASLRSLPLSSRGLL